MSMVHVSFLSFFFFLLLERVFFNLKDVRHYPKVRHKNPTNQKADLKAFYIVVSSFPIDKIISIDEISLWLHSCSVPIAVVLWMRSVLRRLHETYLCWVLERSHLQEWWVGKSMKREQWMPIDLFVEFVRSIITEHHLENHSFLFDNAVHIRERK